MNHYEAKAFRRRLYDELSNHRSREKYDGEDGGLFGSLGACAAYNKLHGFEETRVYCHVFYLGDTLYKKFILCAKRDTTSWKAECTFPSDSEALLPTDTVPPGQVFGSFFSAE